MLKHLLFVLLFSLGPLAAASAQAPSAEALSIAQIYHANSGITQDTLERSFALRTVQWRVDLTGQPAFQMLPEERRAAVLALFDTAPNIVREELEAAKPAAAQAFALQIDAMIPARYLPSIARFINSPLGQRCVQALFEFRTGDLRERFAEVSLTTSAEFAQLDRFLQYRAGHWFHYNWIHVNRAFFETAEAPFTRALDAAGARIEDAYCAAMGPYCEPEALNGAPSPAAP